jgi:hypothetical protein
VGTQRRSSRPCSRWAWGCAARGSRAGAARRGGEGRGSGRCQLWLSGGPPLDQVEGTCQRCRGRAALALPTPPEHGPPSPTPPPPQQEHAGGAGEVVAIVDPPRAGLHKKVLAALRGCGAIRRLVYVACNPASLARDVAALCRPGGSRGGASGVWGLVSSRAPACSLAYLLARSLARLLACSLAYLIAC